MGAISFQRLIFIQYPLLSFDTSPFNVRNAGGPGFQLPPTSAVAFPQNCQCRTTTPRIDVNDGISASESHSHPEIFIKYLKYYSLNINSRCHVDLLVQKDCKQPDPKGMLRIDNVTKSISTLSRASMRKSNATELL